MSIWFRVVTLDDATGEIYSAILVEEGTVSSFRGLIETVAAKGLFCSLYSDRGSHYFHTPEGGRESGQGRPDASRALAQLGIEHIAAYSPEAHGRSERAFHTLQDRLPEELALAGVTDVEAANRYIREVYLPAHNARFAVEPADKTSAFVSVAEAQWRDIPCVQEERVVAPDSTVAWDGQRLQIPPHPARAILCAPRCARATTPDGEIAVGPWAEPLGPMETEWRGGSRNPALRGFSRFGGGAPGCGRRGHKAAPCPTPPTAKTCRKAVNLCAT